MQVLPIFVDYGGGGVISILEITTFSSSSFLSMFWNASVME